MRPLTKAEASIAQGIVPVYYMECTVGDTLYVVMAEDEDVCIEGISIAVGDAILGATDV